jgi:hypothetical protein
MLARRARENKESVVDDQEPILEIDLAEVCERGYAGEWLPLKVLLRRPPSRETAARVKFVSCRTKDVQLDADLLQGDVEIRPGETYRLTIPICVPTPTVLDLGTITFQVATPGAIDQQVPLTPRPLAIHPAIGKEVKTRLHSLCAYTEGTKAQLTLAHEGRTRFDDFTVTLGPDGALAAGKRVLKRAAFAPGDQEQFEVVIAGDHLDIDLSAQVAGLQTSARLRLPVPRVAGRQERRFRFLEPRRLSLDQKSVSEEGGRPVEPVHAAYPLHGDQRYRIVIRPQMADVQKVELHDIPGVVHVLRVESDSGQRAWTFLVDVSTKGRWSKPERLYYDVMTPHERLTGEIHVCLKPPRWSHATLAFTLGLALTVQGFGALARFLLKPDFSLEDALGHFHLASDYQILFLLFVPIALGGLALYDWLQYRFRT